METRTLSRYLLCYMNEILILLATFDVANSDQFVIHHLFLHFTALFLLLTPQHLACVIDTLMPSFRYKGGKRTASQMVHLHSGGC